MPHLKFERGLLGVTKFASGWAEKENGIFTAASFHIPGNATMQCSKRRRIIQKSSSNSDERGRSRFQNLEGSIPVLLLNFPRHMLL